MSILPADSTLTYVDPNKDREEETRPLDFGLIIRLLRLMNPHARRRNWLFLIVVIRSAQLPLLALTAAWILSGPITRAARDAADRGVIHMSPIWFGVAVFGSLAVFTQITLHFRQRLSLELGEAVVRDLRRDLFTHLQKMSMSFYDRTMLGRIIIGGDIARCGFTSGAMSTHRGAISPKAIGDIAMSPKPPL